jgi:hypothetical protein
MKARLRWFALLASVMAIACDSGEADGFKGPVASGAEECLKYMAWTVPLKPACTDCLHQQCAPAWQTMSQVCAGDPSSRCQGDGGTALPTLNFCACMVSLKQGCGEAAGGVYACFVNECSAACGADAGAPVLDAGGGG